VLILDANISFVCMKTRCAGIVGCYSVIVEPSCQLTANFNPNYKVHIFTSAAFREDSDLVTVAAQILTCEDRMSRPTCLQK